jgi:hypothetical protein
MNFELDKIVNLDKYPLMDQDFQQKCHAHFKSEGSLVLPNFLNQKAIDAIQHESAQNKELAYFTNDHHNIYLTPLDSEHPQDHPHNRLVLSSKGCLATDQIPNSSPLFGLYNADEFRGFLSKVLDEKTLHEYADPLSSINLNYADDGQELGWHYDNSSFAITLMIQAPDQGGEFEYVKDVRNADSGEMNFAASEKVLNGETPAKTLEMDDGTLVLFAGRNSMHRVTPVVGDKTRILVVLAYNSEPGISLSELARMTFFGRLN